MMRAGAWQPNSRHVEFSFQDYVLNRPYDFGRGSKASWHFIAWARGQAEFPDAKSWSELRRFLNERALASEMIEAARVVWSSYQSQRARLAQQPREMHKNPVFTAARASH